MSNLNDDITIGALKGMIISLPIAIVMAILAIPFMIVSVITDVPVETLLQNLLIFAAAVFLVWLFSKHQIIENGIVGLIVGSLMYTYFKWHSLVCVLIGVTIVGFLFFISYIKIGFWIKTILFSMIVTFMVFMLIYSKGGLFPLPDMIWKTVFFIVFFLENIFIRCTVACNNKLLYAGYVSSKKEKQRDREENQTESATGSFDRHEDQPNIFWFAGINDAEGLKKRYRELMKIYHPDNQAGDTGAVQQIQEEYEELLKKY